MKTAIIVSAILGLSAASITCIAGVAPTHDTSQLSQSGAKIAPPKKDDTEQPKKDEKEKEKEQDKDQKR